MSIRSSVPRSGRKGSRPDEVASASIRSASDGVGGCGRSVSVDDRVLPGDRPPAMPERAPMATTTRMLPSYLNVTKLAVASTASPH